MNEVITITRGELKALLAEYDDDFEDEDQPEGADEDTRDRPWVIFVFLICLVVVIGLLAFAKYIGFWPSN